MHGTRITDLSNKEVINICDGTRYGYVADIEINCVTGQVVAIVVPGHCGWKFWCREDYIIPWEAIAKIGDDIILVDYKLTSCRENKKKRLFS